MKALKGAHFAAFAGEEDDERLTLRKVCTGTSANDVQVEISLECRRRCFRALLDDSELAMLRDFLGTSYGDSGADLLALSDRKGERLTFEHTNKGEPYREGVQVQVEGVDDFPDYIGPFIESSDIRSALAFLAQ